MHNLNITGFGYYSGSGSTLAANYQGGVNCSHNNITNLNINNLVTNFLDCSYNNLSLLDANSLTLLKIPGIDIWNTLTPILFFNCSHNQLSTLLTNNNLVLEIFDCSYNNLASLNIGTITTKSFKCNNNHLTSFSLGSSSKINNLDISHNLLTAFICPPFSYVNENIFSPINDYQTLDCSNNQLTLLDLNNASISELNASNNNIQFLFMKNGYFNEFTNLQNNPNIQYACLDEFTYPAYPSEVEYFKDYFTYNSMNVNVNSYCSLTPGGGYNTITGFVRFDENNDGCDTNDKVFQHMKLKINDGTTANSETFVKENGEFNFHSKTGNFTVTAEPENPSLFTVTPASFTTNFANNNNNVLTQNICITKNGNIKDLEVLISPVTDARPGFDAVYKLIWRNKGNTTLSGTVTLTFDAAKMMFLSSVLPSTVNGNQVTINFNNLIPYANTASELTFKINAATNLTTPVNIGDSLNFNAIINSPSGENTPEDNEFTFKQTVVGNFNPNDITCLEGGQISSSMIGKYLHYIINFENTGTAQAKNIVAEVNINPDDFDITSLQLQNTSHSTYTKVAGNKVEFIMKDINLATLAHGNISLKIKSKNNLVTGDSVSNQANIYFDYNFPVETNNAVTMIKNPTLQVNDITINNSINVYPNPTKDDVNISTDSKIRSVEVYDTQGRIIQKHMNINSTKTSVSIHNKVSGVYIFKIITENDTIIKKVIKY